jgi:hypothetical protein
VDAVGRADDLMRRCRSAPVGGSGRGGGGRLPLRPRLLRPPRGRRWQRRHLGGGGGGAVLPGRRSRRRRAYGPVRDIAPGPAELRGHRREPIVGVGRRGGGGGGDAASASTRRCWVTPPSRYSLPGRRRTSVSVAAIPYPSPARKRERRSSTSDAVRVWIASLHRTSWDHWGS